VVEHLLSICEVLVQSLMPQKRTEKKKKKGSENATEMCVGRREVS
jgi:hypothetical protein